VSLESLSWKDNTNNIWFNSFLPLRYNANFFKFSSSLLLESLLPGESINSNLIFCLSTIVDLGSLVQEFNELLTVQIELS
jgi:hypothetical protein